MALHTPFHDEHATLRNTVHELVEVRDTLGRVLPVTLGLIAREDLHKANLSHHTTLQLWPELPHEGYQFNTPDFHAVERPLAAVDNFRGYLALAKGKERYVAGALAPAFDAVHDLWLTHIGECLDAGVDGVDLRVAQHNRALRWEDYGYEAPILEAYRRLHGESDPAKFDREKQERIIADRYNDFYRKASRLIRGRGKRVRMHVNLLGRRYMGMYWDWPTWLSEGLADAVTLKDVWPGDRKKLAMILPQTRPRGIEVYTCPWLVDQPDASLRETLSGKLRSASQEGDEDGFIVYESASVAAIGADGQPMMFLPSVLEAMHAVAGNGW